MSYIAPTLAGWTSQRFGTHPGGFNPAGGHTGEDIACDVGTPLMAMAGGVVVHVGYFAGTYLDNPWWIEPGFAGFVVSVDYGPYVSHYAHCSSSPVKVGQAVRQGQVVAYSGNTGTATTGPHVHWELMPDGWDLGTDTYGRINPRSIVNGITPQSTTTAPKENTLSAAEVKEIKAAIASSEKRLRDHINAVLIGGYTWKDAKGVERKHYGIAPILEETQRRIALDDADGVNQ